jgi:hypothetical protein
VAFIPPVQNGGSSITSYTVTSSGGQTATGASSPIVVNGLTAGASYTFTVTATNALGTSVSSGTSNSVLLISDPYFSSVSLLLNGDTLADLSSSPKTVTAYGNTQISTANKKYGTGSIYFDGTGDHLTIPYNSNFDFGTGDFTVEAWINFSNLLVTYPVVFGLGRGANGGGPYSAWSIRVVNNAFEFYRYDGTTEYHYNTGYTPLANQWYHVAVVKTSGTLKIFVDGTSYYSNTVSTSFSSINTDPIYIGYQYYGASPYDTYFPGYIDDLRITKGIARYTSNFTPPTAAFPTS